MLAGDVLAAPAAHLLETRRVRQQPAHGGGELLGGEAGEDDAAARPGDEGLGAPARRGDDREPGGERLGGDDPEALLAGGEDEERGAAEVLGNRRHPARRLDAWGQ